MGSRAKQRTLRLRLEASVQHQLYIRPAIRAKPVDWPRLEQSAGCFYRWLGTERIVPDHQWVPGERWKRFWVSDRLGFDGLGIPIGPSSNWTLRDGGRERKSEYQRVCQWRECNQQLYLASPRAIRPTESNPRRGLSWPGSRIEQTLEDAMVGGAKPAIPLGSIQRDQHPNFQRADCEPRFV